MATLEKLRNRAGVLVTVVIGLALVAFVLGDLLSTGGSLFNRSQLEIAEISGRSIPYLLYQGKVEEVENLNKMFSGDNSLDEQTMERIREQVWQQLIRENVMEDEYDRLGLTIHPDELFDMVQGRNIHPIIQQQFGNQQTGEVNKAQIIQFLKNMDKDPSGKQKHYWLYLENEIKTERIFTKYTNLVRKGLFATNLQSRRALNERNTRVDFSYVSAQYSAIGDSTITVTPSDLSKYYNSHKKDYEQKASRDIEYILFPIRPSADDNKKSEEWMARAIAEFAVAPDPKQYVAYNSDSPFDAKSYKNGELPVEINDWAFSAKVGDISKLQFNGESYKISRLAEISYSPDSVKARHILIGPSDQTKLAFDAAKAKADSLLVLIRKGGKFDRLAKENSADPGSASKGGDLGWFREGTMVKPFNDFCFSASKGEIRLVETEYGFHIIELIDRSKEVKKVQVATLEHKVVPSNATNQTIFAAASEFAGTNSTIESFTAAAETRGLSKRLANNLLENDRKIAGLESPRELVRWTYKAKKGEVSPVFEFGDNFVVATLKTIRLDGFATLEQVKEDVKLKVIREKKGELLAKSMQEAVPGTTTLADIAQKLGKPVEIANGISFSSFSIPNAGVEPAVIATATTLPEGKVSNPIKGNNGVYLITVTAINKEQGDPAAEKDRLANTYQSRAYYEAYEALKKNAGIKDKRAKFY